MKSPATLILITAFAIGACSYDSSRDNNKSSNTEIIISKTKLEHSKFSDHRIFVEVLTANNDTLSFFTDTGGGKVIYPEAAEKVSTKIDTVSEEGDLLEIINLTHWLENNGLPGTKGPQFIYRGPRQMDTDIAGILGANWFTDKVWDFDYTHQALSIVDSLNWKMAEEDEVFPLHFLKDDNGNKVSDFPRIQVVVETDTLQMLFDTGATLALNENSKPYFNTNNPFVGTSFIGSSIFTKWREQHPDWTFIRKGELNSDFDVIEVPQLQIGHQEVGPVWFVSRPDENFTKWMSQWMDKEIQGAIGGSCFKYFTSIIVDYNAEKITFRK